MPKTTEKIGLIQPDRYEKYDIEVQNKNMSKIEDEFGKTDSEAQKYAEQAMLAALEYTDQRIKNLIGTAPDHLDTIQELAKAVNDNLDIIEAINVAIKESAKDEEFQQHKQDESSHVTELEKSAWNSAVLSSHEHDNKSILDAITQEFIDLLLEAIEHVTNGTVHVTSTDKELWNTVQNKLNANELPKNLSSFKNDKNYITLEDIHDHTHDNKEVIDGITALLIQKWNEAVSHTIDTDVHLDDADRALLKSVSDTIDSSGIPQKLSQLQNDMNFLQEETDPTVPVWAKQESKPSYTASEVGADARGTASQKANEALVSAKAYTDTKVNELINGAPETLNTLKEVADAITKNETVVQALNESIGTRAKQTDLDTHTGNKSNPHGVTKAQVGLGNVPNVTTNNQTPTFSQASTRANIVSGEKLSVILGKIMKYFTDLKTVAFSGSYNDLTNKPTIDTSIADSSTSTNLVTSKAVADLVNKRTKTAVYFVKK